MARQAGDIFIEGTIDDLTFYKMDGVYYVRLKSSLTGKRFWKDRAFDGSRRSCSRFGKGNRLASLVFRLVSEEKRTNCLFPFLRRKAIALFKEEREAEEVVSLLLDYLVDFGFIDKSIIKEPERKCKVIAEDVPKKEKGVFHYSRRPGGRAVSFSKNSFNACTFSVNAFNSS